MKNSELYSVIMSLLTLRIFKGKCTITFEGAWGGDIFEDGRLRYHSMWWLPEYIKEALWEIYNAYGDMEITIPHDRSGKDGPIILWTECGKREFILLNNGLWEKSE